MAVNLETIGESDGIQMDLLWENSNPSAEFSPQKVSLDLSGYLFILIEFLPYGTAYEQWAGRATNVIPVGKTANLNFSFINQMNGSVGAQAEVVNRLLSTDSTGVTFKDNAAAGVNYKSEIQNTWGVPTKIYGISF